MNKMNTLESFFPSLPQSQVQSLFWHQCSGIRAGLGKVTRLVPDTEEQALEFVEQCLNHNIRLLPSGGGTNTIGCDEDCDNLALIAAPRRKLYLRKDTADGALVTLDASSTLALVLFQLAQEGLGGAAALSGIPGTLGGALSMNAGANGSDIGCFVTEICGVNLTDGARWHWLPEQGGWAYRTSPVPRDVLVTRVTLRLKQVESSAEQQAIRSEKQRRAAVTPAGYSCGSVFRNPEGTTAGRLLDEAGCKGMTLAPFQVSTQHANWLVNPSGTPGSSRLLRQLGEQARQKVWDTHHLRLEYEWRWLGEEK